MQIGERVPEEGPLCGIASFGRAVVPRWCKGWRRPRPCRWRPRAHGIGIGGIALSVKLLETDQARVGVLAHAARLGIDDVARARPWPIRSSSLSTCSSSSAMMIFASA